jgi:hypothetical protein
MILMSDGGYAIAGGHTFGIDEHGTLLWEQPHLSTSLIQTAAGGFFAEKSGVPYWHPTVFCLDAHHSITWVQTLDSRENGKITSMYETPDGTIEVVNTYPDHTRNRDFSRIF